MESMRRHPTNLGVAAGRRNPWLVAGPLAVGLVMLTWLLAFGLTRNPDAYRNPLVGHRAPSLELRSLTSDRAIRLSRFRGQVLVVNFWASWCNDCAVEHPALAEAWRRYRDQGVVELGVVYRDSASNAERFLRDVGGGWPQAVDPGSRTALAYGVRGGAETFIVSPSGRIAAWHAGPVSYPYLSSEIDRLLRRTV
jgi:cytochrome c biogenesis protein CcmG/thiol:disulfide interchange protein DsbE